MADDEIVRIEPYKYNEKDCLGTGSFGEVYKGHHEQKPDQLLAIKRIKKGKLPQSIIDKEIQILQELSSSDVQHSNFVTLLDSVQTDKFVFLIMEYCNGGDLDHYLREKRKLDETTIKVFLQQLTFALNILHKHGIVHRDLKPANILLSHNGSRSIADVTFKIADFGMGRFMDGELLAQTFCGTPVYMAPEMFAQNPKYDYKADLFSVGAIVFQCFTGSLYSAFQKTPPKMPSTTSPELNDLVTRLLCTEPKERISFNDFYNHPFIGMKEYADSRKKEKTAAVGFSAGTIDSEDPAYSLWSSCLCISPRSRKVPKDDKKKILEESHSLPSSSPSQPLSPKGKGPKEGGVQSPIQKNSPHYTSESSPRLPLSPRESISKHVLKTLVVENSIVYGIAHLDMRFYVLCRSPNSLVSHSDTSPFIKVKTNDLETHGVKLPQDIAACPVARFLYVTDIGNNCIWRIEPGYPFKVSRWLSDISAPHTVSMTSVGHVVTFGNQPKLEVRMYDKEAVLMHRVPLPSDVKSPQHAVFTSKGNFIISYGDKDDKKSGVCELSQKGKIVRQFKHKTVKVNHPTHLAIDVDDKVYVADNVNDRILQLDAQLKLERILPTDDSDKLDKPFRLCLTKVKEAKRLLIEHRVNAIDIYNPTL